jgi:hypothetical protein
MEGQASQLGGQLLQLLLDRVWPRATSPAAADSEIELAADRQPRKPRPRPGRSANL